ncbi:MAG: acyltransferase ChoActase/COT/CPT [Piptocephalis tieghemiana]|nr:MAG: acyltransferase ChoActase/COT/CPT [Piptocephalis tieghemiana]
MLQHQADLPRLPVPPLKDTLSKYLRSCRPILSDDEFALTSKEVSEFGKAGGRGEELQRRLESRASNPDTINWLESWWNEVAYFGYRAPLPVYVSYFFAYRDDPYRKDQAQRAASIIQAALGFREEVVSGTLTPDYMRKAPLCMDSFKWLFHACRIPKKPSDYEATFDPHSNQHIAVVCNHHYYILPFTHSSSSSSRLSTPELQAQLQWILKDAHSRPPASAAIGALTTQDRDVWTEQRDALLKADPKNAQGLRAIESSAFLLSLDSASPVTREELSWACWQGGDQGRNRFYDKSLQFIVFANGKAGFNGEHSSMDGMVTSRLNDSVCSRMQASLKEELSLSPPTNITSLPQPTRLEFSLPSNLTSAIDQASRDFSALVGSHQLRVVAYPGYGASRIKREFRASPDAYIQQIIQLAYYRMHGVSRPTYESAQTRLYAHGRTETCRSVSIESSAWVKAMDDPKISVQEKVRLCRASIDAHVKYISDAVKGHGVDRHLFGLRKCIAEGESQPGLFQDPAYARSCHWNLSTSQLTSEHYDGYGWGEVVPDGFGVAYMIKDRSIHFNIVSQNQGSDRLAYFLQEAATDMGRIFEEVTATSTPADVPVKAKL